MDEKGRATRLSELPHAAVELALRRFAFTIRWRSASCDDRCEAARAVRRGRLGVAPSTDRDEALKVFLQNLLDSMLIAFMWGISRCWSVRVD